MERLVVCILALSLFMGKALAGKTADTGTHSKQQLRHDTSFIRSMQFTHKLRICNAYPMTEHIDVFIGTETTVKSLEYKKCGETMAELKLDTQLDFQVEDQTIGTFVITSLPSNDAVLQLVIYRHDPFSSTVSFESHVFANLLSPQIAVIDTYRGSAKTDVRIEDLKSAEKTKESRSELLRYDSVVAVNPGKYEVSLVGSEGKGQANQTLVALPKESYVVMRVGVEAEDDTPYPQEVVVFPQSNAAELGAAASFVAPWFTTLLAVLATLLFAGHA